MPRICWVLIGISVVAFAVAIVALHVFATSGAATLPVVQLAPPQSYLEYTLEKRWACESVVFKADALRRLQSVSMETLAGVRIVLYKDGPIDRADFDGTYDRYLNWWEWEKRFHDEVKDLPAHY